MLVEDVQQFDRMPPQAIEAERCLLGSMMLATPRSESMRLRRMVTREVFYQVDHQIIFDAIVSLVDAERPVDVVTVVSDLRRRGMYEEVGGTDYVAEILSSVPSFAHADHYARIVKEKFVLREVVSIANDAIRDAYAPAHSDDSATERLTKFSHRLSALIAGSKVDEVVTIGQVAGEVYERLEAGVVNRIPTGIGDLDQVTGGLAIGRFTQIGGRPGMGKSQLVKQLLRNIAATGRPVGIVTIEETREKIGENSLAAESGIDNHKIAYGIMPGTDWQALADAVVSLSKLPMYIMDRPLKLHEVEAAVTTLAVEKKCEVVAVDYLQCIDADIENENREITKISKALKAAWKRLNIAGIAAVQLNRGNEVQGNRRPTLRDLRGSGSLEQDGDTIILLHREDYYRKGDENFQPDHKLEAIVEKNKDGCTGTVPLWFSGARQTISNWNGGFGDGTARSLGD